MRTPRQTRIVTNGYVFRVQTRRIWFPLGIRMFGPWRTQRMARGGKSSKARRKPDHRARFSAEWRKRLAALQESEYGKFPGKPTHWPDTPTTMQTRRWTS